ncbi:TRAM, LAG1 and CLN8 (TLC) lipid-sensing domain containing protein [Actinidia rufa]|uniref:TRAM, LAG1 and CLN8 (TLC) lipid-sensing domain containing protein n=1 Tax=Actinidia rufa TaxID=165716 RepID=A0A7J0GUA8_9ERIC|nr:TRAM, LAG1 and CLN8 (TLC) lipid-sensing domain containing protein [Actinidia rufa]
MDSIHPYYQKLQPKQSLNRQTYRNAKNSDTEDSKNVHLSAAVDFMQQVKKMSTFGVFLVVTAPSVLYVMNLIWFGKIIRGLKKTLAKRD